MSLGVTQSAATEDLIPDAILRGVLKLGDTVNISQDVRISALMLPADGSINLNVERYHLLDGNVRGELIGSDTIEFHPTDAQLPDPPEDELDPVTGDVLVPAGSRAIGLPSVVDLKLMLLEAPGQLDTVGDGLDWLLKNIYALALALNPEWTDAVEI
jgi:hypothetical protein